MSFLKRNRQLFAWAQQIGASTPHETQQDRVRVEFVHTTGGKKVLLAVIADGEHHPDAGNTAEYIVNYIFNQFKHQKGVDFTQQLAHTLEVAGRSIEEKDGQVAVTTIALYRNRLYFAHSGHTAAFLIRGRSLIALTQPNPTLLGMASVDIQRGDVGGLRLQPGDQILLTTDSLFRASPEDGRPFVDPEDIPTHVEGNSPDDASRHLVSLAMGRDVDDNVTVAILQILGEKRRSLQPRKWLALLIVAIAIFTLVQFIPSALKDESPPPVTDYGYAVLVEGSALVETNGGDATPAQRLEAVAPLSWILTQEDSRFALQSNVESSFELSSASIYLSRGSRVLFTLIDAGINFPAGLEALSDRTIFEINSGALFIQRTTGSRVYQVDFDNKSISLTGNGRGAMGISISLSGIEMDCLLGICEVISEENDVVVLQAETSLTAVEGRLGKKESTSPERFARWNTLGGYHFDE